MRNNLKAKFSFLSVMFGCGVIVLLQGCGGGSSSPSVPTPTVATPFDASYRATFVPSDSLPADAQAPTGSIQVVKGKASLQTTFYLQPTVVKAVQKAIDDGLTNAGYPSAIRSNQVPSTIAFTGTGLLDSNGKVVLTSRKDVDICGRATLTVDPTFVVNANGQKSGTANYQISFPNNLTISLRGNREVSGTCNNLPLRTGTVTLAP